MEIFYYSVSAYYNSYHFKLLKNNKKTKIIIGHAVHITQEQIANMYQNSNLQIQNQYCK